jgi:cobalt/nickel transport system permease protein
LAHIPDGFLSPQVIAATAALSVGALALAARKSKDNLGEQEAPLLGAATAFVFAAQMLNFPLGAGTSAHLLGGVLVAVLVGPWVAMLVLFSVLLVQALLFQDGGIAALGANTLNMAVLGVGGGYVVYRWLLALLGSGFRRQIAAAAAGAYVSAVLVGTGVALELALSGTLPLLPAVVAIGGGHLAVGFLEALLTGAILAVLLRTHPRMLADMAARAPSRRKLAYAVVSISGLLAILAGYVASSRPDVLERAVRRLGIDGMIGSYFSGPFADYTAPLGGPWVAAVAGIIAVFAFGIVVSRVVGKGRRDG